MEKPPNESRISPGWKLAGILGLAVALPLLASCNFYGSYRDRYAKLQPEVYALIAPKARLELPCVQEFASFQRSRGLTVVPIAILEGAPLPAQRRTLAAALSEAAAGRELPGYALILASPEELSMGPWAVEGVEEEIASDLPWFAPPEAAEAKVLKEEHWRPLVEGHSTWIAGRVPYEDPDLVAVVLEASQRISTAAGSKSALLGAERFQLWWDSSLVLATARNHLRGQGWEAVLCAEDRPRDLPLGGERVDIERTVGSLETRDPETGETLRTAITRKATVSLGFPRRWLESSPRLVYLIAHSSLFADRIGKDLMSVEHLLALRSTLSPEGNVAPPESPAASGAPFRPATPAILVTTGCSSGQPGSPLVRQLFSEGWIAAFVGSMAPNGPLPFFPAIHAETNLARFFGSGLPIGLAVQAAKECYARQSRWALTRLLPGAGEQLRINLFTYVIYGDPSVVR